MNKPETIHGFECLAELPAPDPRNTVLVFPLDANGEPTEEAARQFAAIVREADKREADTLRAALSVEIDAIREKERFFWRAARPSLGANAVALLLDGIASRLEIVCGFAPPPKGRKEQAQ